MEAEDRGGHHGVQLDDSGNIGEGAICNLGFVLRRADGRCELASPPFSSILSGECGISPMRPAALLRAHA